MEVSMEHKTADRPNWKRVTERTFDAAHKAEGCFKGNVTAIHLKKVSDPLVVQYKNHQVCIADSGYIWLQHFPEGKKYTVTTVLDQNGDVVQFYIDICMDHGVNDDGIPWFLDLYLDIVILPDKEIFILDDNELIDAFNNEVITDKEMNLAHQTVEEVLSMYKKGEFEDLKICEKHATEWFRGKKFV
jgi:uncharacterized protein